MNARPTALIAMALLALHCGRAIGPLDTGLVATADASGDAPPCFPPCLEALSVRCPTSLACTAQVLSYGDPSESLYCFTTGTVEDIIADVHGHERVIARDATGATCFTFEADVGTDPILGTFTDAAGNLVATLEESARQPMLAVVTCGGVRHDVDVSAAACEGHVFGHTDPCTTGTCPH